MRTIEMRALWTLGTTQNSWVRLLTYITDLVNQELLLQNEYLAAENRILRAHLLPRLRVWSKYSIYLMR